MAGMLLGVFDFSAFWAQTVGLENTTPGINAFLTATYCVIVPFLWWVVARKRPTVFNVGAGRAGGGGAFGWCRPAARARRSRWALVRA